MLARDCYEESSLQPLEQLSKWIAFDEGFREIALSRCQTGLRENPPFRYRFWHVAFFVLCVRSSRAASHFGCAVLTAFHDGCDIVIVSETGVVRIVLDLNGIACDDCDDVWLLCPRVDSIGLENHNNELIHMFAFVWLIIACTASRISPSHGICEGGGEKNDEATAHEFII